MLHGSIGVRPFLGAKDLDVSRPFLRELGSREVVISASMPAFNAEQVWF